MVKPSQSKEKKKKSKITFLVPSALPAALQGSQEKLK